jgi:hypothetical protein
VEIWYSALNIIDQHSVLLLQEKEGFQDMSGADIIRATMKQKKEEQDEEQGNSEHISHCMTLECAHTLIHYMDHWDFEYNDITSRKKI